MKYIFKFYQFSGKYKLQMAALFGVLTVSVVLETIRPYWLKLIIDGAIGQNFSQMTVYLGLFGISTIGGNLVSALGFWLGDKVMVPLAREIRETVFKRVMDLDFAYHVEKSTGSLISAFRRGDGAVFNLYFNINQELFRVLISLLVTLVFLARADLVIAGIMIVMLLINLWLIWWLISKNLKTRSEFNTAEDEVSGVIADSMLNYETVKFFAAENKEKDRLGKKFDVWVDKIWKFTNTFRLMDISIGTVSGAGMMLIMWIAINRVGKGFGASDLVMVAGFITGFYYQFFNLFFRIRDIAKSMTDLEKYLGILENEIKVKDPEKPIKLDKVSGEIEFKNIGFVYPKNKSRVLDRVNLVIKPGEKVAFVGRSGAGKTTITKLLMRFYDPSEGAILIDGVDIKDMKKSDLRGLMGMVPQEPIMFNNSIKFNLAYGKEKATMKEIREAADKANILEFIEKLPKKWETQVGERGIKLSGGQKQRLAIARALLADPKILIFDEATSNLDSESEKKIQTALLRAGKDRTVIIIAHRFSTIRDSDKIIVLSNGNIVETGKHVTLIKTEGIYKMLWTLQSKGKLPEVAA